ncbi:MAG: alpha-ketoglutarate-dependent dioxygenase AlkB [Silicimonas sp.]|nr:alpha-ketoglutarate-dependent dioxygenase AlkB [Silicimonas sp.]
MNTPLDLNGVTVWKGLLDRDAQENIVAALRILAEAAPFRTYLTPGGKAMSVRMTGAGPLAWVSDRSGYGYAPLQPDGGAWPEIPACLFDVWRQVAEDAPLPDSCLVNFYGEGTKMGMHQDRDEAELSHPVVSISLGDEALFRVGGRKRGGPTKSVWLASGDVAVLSGEARLAYHGIDRVRFGSGTLLPKGGRINVTLRVAGAYSSRNSAARAPERSG